MGLGRRRLNAFLERQCELLALRDIDGLIALYRTPITLYFPGGIIVMAEEADLRFRLERVCEALDDDHVARVEWTVEGCTESSGRMTAIMAYRYLDASGSAVRRARARYFFDLGDDHLDLLLVDYLQGAFPEVVEATRDKNTCLS